MRCTVETGGEEGVLSKIPRGIVLKQRGVPGQRHPQSVDSSTDSLRARSQ